MSESPATPGAPSSGTPSAPSTATSDYTQRLARLEQSGIKRFVPTQAPYRWNLQRLQLGRVLDVGCGLGRNLLNCGPDSVGVDHNPHSVQTCRERGLNAYTPDELAAAPDCGPGSFDSMLIAHVLEHIDEETAASLLEQYLPLVRPGGSVVMITPQELGYRTDATHIRWVGFEEMRSHAGRAGIAVRRTYSFPFPRPMGKVFPYNEFVLVGTVPA
ncbi:class I SAM-dependent methyltransferase [Streptomyces sp. NPDC059558]|uniref:class I SAM-dependent methyltransferase n=1 Tax=unclassified Streptomyces TaxID=2593676 RepID=UPI0006ADCD22|nr:MULTISPECIES: class I SAM-dependent methyltransferase [unclassified Streptomyces]ARE76394.1 SAM-dependent methyltransferase [Streptomyces sp. Sge12]KOU19638.1 methyltransferase type 11 [Streptomyces sp. WM6368]